MLNVEEVPAVFGDREGVGGGGGVTQTLSWFIRHNKSVFHVKFRNIV